MVDMMMSEARRPKTEVIEKAKPRRFSPEYTKPELCTTRPEVGTLRSHLGLVVVCLCMLIAPSNASARSCETSSDCVDDANPCTIETCIGSTCVVRACSFFDAPPCAPLVCDPASGCVIDPAGEGATCDDGNACTVDDVCSAGACTGAAVRSCDDDNACTADSCDSADGCRHANLADGVFCSDDNACTTGSSCLAGECGIKVRPRLRITHSACKVGSPCRLTLELYPMGVEVAAIQFQLTSTTQISCDETSSAFLAGNEGGTSAIFVLPSRLACNVALIHLAFFVEGPLFSFDVVFEAPGQASVGLVITDFSDVALDTCLPDDVIGNSADIQVGECALDADCQDGDACNGAETCVNTICQPGVALECDDHNTCTDDSCDPAAGCTAAANSAPCDDGLFCTLNDVCRGGQCVGSGDPCAAGPECANTCSESSRNCAAPKAAACSTDGDLCTFDQCDGAGTCIHFETDTDADQIPDACDACVVLDQSQTFDARSTLLLRKIGTDTTADNDGLKFSGSFVLPAGARFSSLDPSTTGVRVLLSVMNDADTVDVMLTSGLFDRALGFGWSRNARGTRWRFRDSTRNPALNGIRSLVMRDQSSRQLGRIRVAIKAKRGTYQVVAGDRSVNLTVVVGAPATGECGTTAFGNGACVFVARTVLRCE